MGSLRATDTVVQLGWYAIVGGAAFVVDIACFVALAESGFPVLVASALSFVMATIVNYFMCYKLAFVRGRFERANEIMRLFGVALIGLGLNTFFVWLFITYTPMPPVMAKVSAVPLVFGWNFLGRRSIVFYAKVPSSTFAITQFIVSRGRLWKDLYKIKSEEEKPRVSVSLMDE